MTDDARRRRWVWEPGDVKIVKSRQQERRMVDEMPERAAGERDLELEQAFAGFFEDFDRVLALEERIAPFNLFEAVGMQRAEVRHSHFLAYILDANRSHGFGDEYLKRFLYRALTDIGSTDPLPAEVMIADLGESTVERERENIDVLITVEDERLVVAIENKIDAAETGDQLIRYHDWVEDEFDETWRKVYLFLSPTGKEPSHDGWAPLSYRTVLDAMDWLLRARDASLSPDVRFTLEHYREMMERHVLDEDRNREIARKLYQKHKEVFDFVYDSIPNLGDTLISACMGLIDDRADVVPISGTKGFKPAAFAGKLIVGDLTGEAAQSIYFEITVASDTRLWLWLGPAPSEFRERMFEAARAAGAPFSPRPELTSSWTYLIRETLLAKSEKERLSSDEVADIVRERLGRFLDEHLQKITATVLREVDRFTASGP